MKATLLFALVVCLGAGEGAPATSDPPKVLMYADAAAPPEYSLYPGDVLRITVYDNPDLTTDVVVPAAGGTVPFPLIGRVENLDRMTAGALAADIQKRLLDGYLRRAEVSISVRAFVPRTVSLMGSVERTLVIALDPLRPTTAVQAIAQAGGFREDADRRRSVVLRADPAAPARLVSIPVPPVGRNGPDGPDVVLQPNDIILIPRLDRAYVLGQVGAPGAVSIPSEERLTVSKAVSLAGGFSRFAKQSEVQLIRSGKPVLVVDVRAVLSGDRKAEDPELGPGDTVFVPESRL